MPDPSPAPVSPTGQPIVPAKVVPYIATLAGIAGLVAGLPQAGLTFLPPQVAAIAGVVFGVCLLLLGLSPGMRMNPGAAMAAVQQAAADAQKAGQEAAKDPGPTLGG